MARFLSPDVESEVAGKNWDVIIIGSGLGGLTAASLLARAGKRVLVLERHSVPGGFTHTFKRMGFEWDVGVHYVGQVGDPKSILRKFFDYVTQSAVQWDPMGDVYDQVRIAGESYDFVSGVENQIALLSARFPGEESAIREYYRLIRKVGASSAWFFGEKSMPPWLSRWVGWLLRKSFLKMSQKTTYEVIRGLTENERLISVLCAQCGDYGLAPKQSSFGIHAVVVEHYLNGGSYPRGGAARIHEALQGVLEKFGGELILKAEVSEIMLEGAKAVGVRLKSGSVLRSNAVISNTGARNTFTRLLPEYSSPDFDPTRDLRQIAPSSAHLCLYLGIRGSDRELGLPKHNIWIYDRIDFDDGFRSRIEDPEGPVPLLYVSFPSAKDSTWPNRHPDQSTVQIIAGFPYAYVKRWENQPYGKRDPEYLDFKRRMTDRLTEAVIREVPQLAGRIVCAELSTPLSTRHFMNYPSGEIYGLAHTPARFTLRWLRPQTPIKNLYLTGQDVVTVGVGGAFFSGILAAARVLDRFIFWPILMGRPLAKEAKMAPSSR